LEPHGVPDDQRELLETNVGRPGVGPDRFSDDLAPLMLQAEFEESGLKAQALGEAGENRAEGIERAGSRHGGIVARTAAG
jgi:hypothetical protein